MTLNTSRIGAIGLAFASLVAISCSGPSGDSGAEDVQADQGRDIGETSEHDGSSDTEQGHDDEMSESSEAHETSGDHSPDHSSGDSGPDGGNIDAPDSETDADMPSRKTIVALLADTHVIDGFYNGREGNDLDTETIYRTRENLSAVRDRLNTIDMRVEAAFIAGDFWHNYPEIPGQDMTEYQTYVDNRTRIDEAKDLIDGFAMPVYPGFGNHDYDPPQIPRELTNRLIRDKLGVEPYYFVDVGGFRFVMLNSLLGDSWNPASPRWETDKGSFGAAQLEWLEDILKQGVPSILIFHHPIAWTLSDETGDGRDIRDVVDRYRNTVKLVATGHVHLWMDYGADNPPEIGIGSTRYDTDAYMLLELDADKGTYRIINDGCLVWLSLETWPFDETDGCLAEW